MKTVLSASSGGRSASDCGADGQPSWSRRFFYVLLAMVGRSKDWLAFIPLIATVPFTRSIPRATWARCKQLHARTNGWSTDVLNTVIALRQGGAKSAALDSPLFGRVEPEEIDRICGAIAKNSYYIFGKRLPERLIAELRQIASTQPASPFPPPDGFTGRIVYNPRNPVAPTYNFRNRDLVSHPVYNTLADEPLFRTIASVYMGVPAMLDYIEMWWSATLGGVAFSENAQLFHYDLAHPKWLKFFVYLSDVDGTKGPHVVVPGTHGRDKSGKALRKRSTQRILDEEIIEIYGRPGFEIVGPAGTMLAVDTRAFHKGKAPLQGDRLILQLYFTNSHIAEDTPARTFVP
jgi:hypothetical protein